ncbi:anthranilate synthase component I family protein [Caldicellulosiruptor morganii]|uniref:Anthranilate synthase component I family protein n=1 Tax=Caldicellulosiruptor morganii TaxID=1387555 RepID=A0ABY7BPC9_9FIRM|nr:anthranilate synthase component I family protein [Caldicellulosiruptor morganii]WAM34684.1 anthranilate synthase component I family protein [Caldicellulosiruptor morganii]
MNKQAKVCPDSSSGLFDYDRVFLDISFFEEYCDNSIDISNIDFDSINGDYFYFENSQIAAFCYDILLSIKIFASKIVLEGSFTEIIEQEDILETINSILMHLIKKNAFVTAQFNYHAINLIENIYLTDRPYIIFRVFKKNLIIDKTSKTAKILIPKGFVFEKENFNKFNMNNRKTASRVLYNTPKDYYISTVKQAKEDIRNGEIFQIVLSQVIKVESDISTSQLFYTMKEKNPSEYSIVLDTKDEQIICFSPETLIKKEGNIVKTFPIAGTYRITDSDDIVQKKIEILKDKKEISEHVMLVDLARNDLGRISKAGSVRVDEYLQIKKLYNLIHIYSVVTGELEEENLVKAILSVFPAGTLTGAPKVRAMQLIEKYEEQRRNLYGGAIGYIYKDTFDLAIAIRMAVKNKSESTFVLQSGAGIVNLSVPEKEYQECLTKLRAFLNIMEVDEDDIVNR